MKTKFNQKQLRAKDSVKFGLTFESLLAGPNFSDQIVEKDTVVNVVESVGIENKWYHKVYVPTVKKTVWIQGSQFANIPDNVIFAHLKINPDPKYISEKMNKIIQPGYVTVATTRKSESYTNLYEDFEYGFSFCSPEDIFSKKVGRKQSKEMLARHAYAIETYKEPIEEKLERSTYERCFCAMVKYVQYCRNNKIVIPWFPINNIDDIEKFRQCDLIG